MSSKVSKTTTNKNPRTTNNEPRTTAASSETRCCEDCEHSIPAGGQSARILTCRNQAGAPARFCIVDPDHCCPNFTADKEILAPELVRALAEGAKLIPLTQDKFAIVDADDYEWLNQYKWYVSCQDNVSYAKRMERRTRRQIIMHRAILNAPPHMLVDHINHNGLDNRKKNLRLCTKSQNNRNQRPHGKTSEYKGVCWKKREKKFVAQISFKGKRTSLGYFDDEIAAAKAYDRKARELFGQFAYLNFPLSPRT